MLGDDNEISVQAALAFDTLSARGKQIFEESVLAEYSDLPAAEAKTLVAGIMKRAEEGSVGITVSIGRDKLGKHTSSRIVTGLKDAEILKLNKTAEAVDKARAKYESTGAGEGKVRSFTVMLGDDNEISVQAALAFDTLSAEGKEIFEDNLHITYMNIPSKEANKLIAGIMKRAEEGSVGITVSIGRDESGEHTSSRMITGLTDTEIGKLNKTAEAVDEARAKFESPDAKVKGYTVILGDENEITVQAILDIKGIDIQVVVGKTDTSWQAEATLDNADKLEALLGSKNIDKLILKDSKGNLRGTADQIKTLKGLIETTGGKIRVGTSLKNGKSKLSIFNLSKDQVKNLKTAGFLTEKESRRAEVVIFAMENGTEHHGKLKEKDVHINLIGNKKGAGLSIQGNHNAARILNYHTAIVVEGEVKSTDKVSYIIDADSSGAAKLDAMTTLDNIKSGKKGAYLTKAGVEDKATRQNLLRYGKDVNVRFTFGETGSMTPVLSITDKIARRFDRKLSSQTHIDVKSIDEVTYIIGGDSAGKIELSAITTFDNLKDGAKKRYLSKKNGNNIRNKAGVAKLEKFASDINVRLSIRDDNKPQCALSASHEVILELDKETAISVKGDVRSTDKVTYLLGGDANGVLDVNAQTALSNIKEEKRGGYFEAVGLTSANYRKKKLSDNNLAWDKYRLNSDPDNVSVVMGVSDGKVKPMQISKLYTESCKWQGEDYNLKIMFSASDGNILHIIQDDAKNLHVDGSLKEAGTLLDVLGQAFDRKFSLVLENMLIGEGKLRGTVQVIDSGQDGQSRFINLLKEDTVVDAETGKPVDLAGIDGDGYDDVKNALNVEGKTNGRVIWTIDNKGNIQARAEWEENGVKKVNMVQIVDIETGRGEAVDLDEDFQVKIAIGHMDPAKEQFVMDDSCRAGGAWGWFTGEIIWDKTKYGFGKTVEGAQYVFQSAAADIHNDIIKTMAAYEYFFGDRDFAIALMEEGIVHNTEEFMELSQAGVDMWVSEAKNGDTGAKWMLNITMTCDAIGFIPSGLDLSEAFGIDGVMSEGMHRTVTWVFVATTIGAGVCTAVGKSTVMAGAKEGAKMTTRQAFRAAGIGLGKSLQGIFIKAPVAIFKGAVFAVRHPILAAIAVKNGVVRCGRVFAEGVRSAFKGSPALTQAQLQAAAGVTSKVGLFTSGVGKVGRFIGHIGRVSVGTVKALVWVVKLPYKAAVGIFKFAQGIKLACTGGGFAALRSAVASGSKTVTVGGKTIKITGALRAGAASVHGLRTPAISGFRALTNSRVGRAFIGAYTHTSGSFIVRTFTGFRASLKSVARATGLAHLTRVSVGAVMGTRVVKAFTGAFTHTSGGFIAKSVAGLRASTVSVLRATGVTRAYTAVTRFVGNARIVQAFRGAFTHTAGNLATRTFAGFVASGKSVLRATGISRATTALVRFVGNARIVQAFRGAFTHTRGGLVTRTISGTWASTNSMARSTGIARAGRAVARFAGNTRIVQAFR